MSYHGRPYWNELNTWDTQAAMAYYGRMFGWSFEELTTADADDNRPYYAAKVDGDFVAGVFQLVSPDFDGIPDHWFTYFAVDDLDATLAENESAGGWIKRQPFMIPNFGRMCVVVGATGAAQAFIQPVAGEPE